MTKLRSSLLQRQQKILSGTISILHDQVADIKDYISYVKRYPEEGSDTAVKMARKELRKTREAIAKGVELQRFTKTELHEAYWQESFDKVYAPLEQEDDSFWMDAGRMAVEDGYVAPTYIEEGV